MERFRTEGRAPGWQRRLRNKVALAGVLSMGVALPTLATAPPALAGQNNYAWTGSDTSSPNWRQADNWSPSGPPTGTIGTLSFPDLGVGCDNGTSTGTCYSSDEQLGNLTVNQLSIDDDRAYDLSSSNSSTLTLGAGGLSAAPTESSADTLTGTPLIDVPITLGANQTWSIDGGAAGNDYGIRVPSVSFSAPTLTVSFTNGGTLASSSMAAQSLVAS